MTNPASAFESFPSSSHTGWSEVITDLTQIFDPDTQVSVWQRPNPDNAIVEYVKALAHESTTGKLLCGVSRSDQAMSINALPGRPGRQDLVDDIVSLIDIYRELLGCDAVGFRLEKQQAAMCPRFHVDRTGIRMLCTYYGPGTQWLDDRYVDRSRLGRAAMGLPDEVSGLYPPNTPIEQAGVFDVVLLKGSLWQGNHERGAIHRSPEFPTSCPQANRRLMLALDAFWD